MATDKALKGLQKLFIMMGYIDISSADAEFESAQTDEERENALKKRHDAEERTKFLLIIAPILAHSVASTKLHQKLVNTGIW
ncbi:hypothetical protein [Leptospira interrogans]|nr:hypothetical protein [Leptospira interrogans]